MNEVRITRGMISAPHPTAAEAGLEMLNAGGNAIDAAVAAAFAMTVVLPASTGIAGYGGVMMLYLADRGTITAVDYNCRAPAAAREDMFVLREETEGGFTVEGSANVFGPLSVDVPGTVAGLNLALRRFGTLPLDAVLRPAIDAASAGFAVDTYTSAKIIETLVANAGRFPDTLQTYSIEGRPPQPGERLRLRDLAMTLERLGRGADTFYRGEIARAIVETVRHAGGTLTHADLEGYAAREVAPVHARYRGYDIWTPGLPAGGLSVLQMLRVLEGFPIPLRDLGVSHVGAEAGFAHLLIEVAKRCWRERLLRYGDPEFVPVSAKAELDDGLVRRLREDVRDGLASPAPGSVIAPDPVVGTAHLCAADRHGNLVSLTQTHGGSFGSLLLVPGTGVVLSHGLSRFDPRPGRPNSIGPWKRPLHNMAPALVFKDGRAVAALGAAGGRTIINSLLHAVVRLVDLRDAPQAAVTSTRFHIETAEPVQVEAGGEALADGLRVLGHQAQLRPRFGSLQAIYFGSELGALTGVADPRRAGTVVWS